MRQFDWESRLSAYVASVAREGFQWGRHDCGLFAAGGVLALTGSDPAAAWRGRYSTEADGLALIRAAGHDDHIAAARAQFPAVRPAMVMAGDLAVVRAPGGPALGIVQGALIYVLRPDGLGLVPLARARSLLAVR